jgi:hypothetical protein
MMINVESSDTPSKFESKAEEMSVNVVTDKFPGVKDLMARTPQFLFYLVKFWVRIPKGGSEFVSNRNDTFPIPCADEIP